MQRIVVIIGERLPVRGNQSPLELGLCLRARTEVANQPVVVEGTC